MAVDPTPVPSSPRDTVATTPRLGSLQTRLIASHVAVLLVALVLVFAISAGLVRREERRAEVVRLGELAVPLLVETRLLDRASGGDPSRRPLAAALARQAEALGVRLLLLDRAGTVRVDTGPVGGGGGRGDLVGQRPAAVAAELAGLRAGVARRGGVRVRRVATVRRLADNPFGGTTVVLATDARASGSVLAIAAPRRPVPLAGRYLPALGLTLTAALAVAAAVGYALSRRIAAPVSRLTVAADAMAAGALEQRVPGAGGDELGRLVASFNTMSRRVAPPPAASGTCSPTSPTTCGRR